MKKLLLFLLVVVSIPSIAQKGLDEMIAAERSFAAYAVANNTKDAFLKYMDSGAVMFENGEPYKAYERWQKREKRPGVLSWWPLYAEIAASGDFGYTCGPWTFQPTSITDSVVANGFFFTIWQKNKAGEWKFILDVGTDQGRFLPGDTILIRVKPGKTPDSKLGMLGAEKDFVEMNGSNPSEANKLFAAENIIYAREKTTLMGQVKSSEPPGSLSSEKMSFIPLGSGIAPSGDLGYIYGTATLNGKKETYLRIWRHEPSGWKIALQMVRL